MNISDKCDVWDQTLDLLKNSQRFQSCDLGEKAVLLLFIHLTWEIRTLDMTEIDEVFSLL
jgi:hypothetical protein